MYEAIRQRAPFSTRAAGVATTAVLGAAGSYVLLSGFGDIIVKSVQRPMTVISLAPPARPVDPPPAKFDKIDDVTLPTRTPTESPPPEPKFFYEDGKVDAGDPAIPIVSHVARLAPHVPVLTAPKMKPADPPPYPASEIRAGGQGTTALQLCIDMRGRVTSASLARSSGRPVLDEAALKWVRDLRFSPGLSDGAAHAVCGHPVEYVWNLETLRH
jgi:TonB family protein